MNASFLYLTFLLSFFAHVTFASSTHDPPEDGDIRAKVIDVHEGDTFEVNILGHDDSPSIIRENLTIRLRGVDAYEIWGRGPFK
ncbi:MAG: hypothetical protein OXB93_02605, partial [Cytophagales bacterium]|nr:hypothetical protein [Cytophagales bacterium]